MDNNYEDIQMENTIDKKHKKFIEEVKKEIKQQKRMKIKKYLVYLGIVAMIFVIAITIEQMGGVKLFISLFKMLGNDSSAIVPVETEDPSFVEYDLEIIADNEKETEWAYEIALEVETEEQSFKELNEETIAIERAAERQSLDVVEGSTEIETESESVVQFKKIGGTDLYEENPEGQNEISDIAIAKSELLYLKSDGKAWYLIKRGDTLTALAIRFGLTVESIARENSIRNVNLIIAGNELKMPVSSEVLMLLKE